MLIAFDGEETRKELFCVSSPWSKNYPTYLGPFFYPGRKGKKKKHMTTKKSAGLEFLLLIGKLKRSKRTGFEMG
jgi:hypothetical protein